MKNKFLTLNILFLVILFGNQIAFSGTTKEGHTHAIHTMAEVLVHLNHFPSNSEKDNLHKIMSNDSTTMMEHILIMSLIDLQHKTSAANKEKLQKIMDDNSAPKDLRDLASIIYHLNHKPTAADKKILEYLMK